jgi:hypothetical protein
MASVKVVSAELYQERILTSSALYNALEAAGCSLVVSGVPGIGKTTALAIFILSGIWKTAYDVVIVLLCRRQLINDLADNLRNGMEDPSTRNASSPVYYPGIDVAVYPSIQEVPCGPSDEIVDLVENRGCSVLAKIEICDSCEYAESCAWRNERNPECYQKRSVILIPEQVLTHWPEIINQIAGDRRALVINDEAELGKKGFVSEIAEDQWQAQKASASRAGYSEIVDAMDIAEQGGRADISLLPDLGEIAKHLQASGVHIPGYSYQMPLVYAHIEFPLWEESGVRAILRRPYIPSST